MSRISSLMRATLHVVRSSPAVSSGATRTSAPTARRGRRRCGRRPRGAPSAAGARPRVVPRRGRRVSAPRGTGRSGGNRAGRERPTSTRVRRGHVVESLAAARREPAARGGRVLVVEGGSLHLEDAASERLRHVRSRRGSVRRARSRTFIHATSSRSPRSNACSSSCPRRREGSARAPSRRSPHRRARGGGPAPGGASARSSATWPPIETPTMLRAVDAERREQLGHVRRVDERAVRQGGVSPNPRRSHRDHAVALSEHRHHVVPHRPVRDAGVEEEERRPFAAPCRRPRRRH